jgi:hypothetical protein
MQGSNGKLSDSQEKRTEAEAETLRLMVSQEE